MRSLGHRESQRLLHSTRLCTQWTVDGLSRMFPAEHGRGRRGVAERKTFTLACSTGKLKHQGSKGILPLNLA